MKRTIALILGLLLTSQATTAIAYAKTNKTTIHQAVTSQAGTSYTTTNADQVSSWFKREIKLGTVKALDSANQSLSAKDFQNTVNELFLHMNSSQSRLSIVQSGTKFSGTLNIYSGPTEWHIIISANQKKVASGYMLIRKLSGMMGPMNGGGEPGGMSFTITGSQSSTSPFTSKDV